MLRAEHDSLMEQKNRLLEAKNIEISNSKLEASDHDKLNLKFESLLLSHNDLSQHSAALEVSPIIY